MLVIRRVMYNFFNYADIILFDNLLLYFNCHKVKKLLWREVRVLVS